MNEKFKIIIMFKQIINDYDELFFNTKEELKNKDNILEECYGILKIIYIANDTYDKVKKKNLQIEILSRIKYLEYLTTKLNIDEKVCNRYIYKLNTISKYIQNWIKYTSALV